jgi:hypothetical protein
MPTRAAELIMMKMKCDQGEVATRYCRCLHKAALAYVFIFPGSLRSFSLVLFSRDASGLAGQKKYRWGCGICDAPAAGSHQFPKHKPRALFLAGYLWSLAGSYVPWKCHCGIYRGKSVYLQTKSLHASLVDTMYILSNLKVCQLR